MAARHSIVKAFLRGAVLAAVAAAVWWGREVLTPDEAVAGAPHVVDGDSLEIDGRRLRLRGLDAPELAQTCAQAGAPFACGRAARAHLVDLVGGARLDCRGSEIDRYQRLLVACRARGRDVGAEMVRAGWALAYGDYRAEEAEARRERRGLWAGAFESPDAWRRSHRRAGEE